MKMSVKCEKMVLIPPSTNHWPQSEEIDGGSKASSGNEEAEKCPRCESSNTKFCYYNNYSLSQPRYFCKACKRYWTKGGTLRNVPVGGGCRKNKRATPLKRPSTTCSTSDHITPINSSAPHINPLFYGFPNNNSMNLPLFPARFNYCNTTSSGGFDLEPGSVNASANYNGFDSSCTMFGGSSCASATPLLMSRERNTISTTFEENMQMGSDHEEVVASKDVKNQLEEHVPTTTTLYDPSSLYYWSNMPLSSMVGGVWNNDHQPNNIASAPSLTSLI